MIGVSIAPGSEPHSAETRILFDLTRTIARVHHAAPRGIDRVALEYALFLEGLPQDRVSYCFHHAGAWRVLARPVARWLLAGLARRWLGWDVAPLRGGFTAQRVLRRPRARSVLRAAFSRPLRRPDHPTVYLNVSHKAWRPLGELRRLGGDSLKIVALLHDVMPLSCPQFFPSDLREEFRAGLDVLMQEADLLITNTRDTRCAVEAWAQEQRVAMPPTVHVPFGIRTLPHAELQPALPEVPHFVCFGGADPRKNFALMKAVWSRLAARVAAGDVTGAPLPRLYVLGLQEGACQVPGVVPVPRATDLRVAELLRTARALLFPSLAEGFGFPVWEAFAAGAPAICSDLPVFREIGGSVAELLPPDSVEHWVEAVLEYSHPDSLSRQRQVLCLQAYRVPTWSGHFSALGELLRDVLHGVPAGLIGQEASPASASHPRARVHERASEPPALSASG